MQAGSSSQLEEQDTVDVCRRLQSEEFEVLESIYPECVSSQITEGTLKLEVPVEFDGPRKLLIVQDKPTSPSAKSPGAEQTSSSSLEVEVSILPPLLVNVALPSGYPLTEPPQLTSIRATHLWAPRIGMLNKLLMTMWQPGEGVLYNWVEYLRTGEFLPALDLLGQSGADSIIEISHPNPSILAPLLSAYETLSKSSQFAQTAYPCSICLTTLKGAKCLQLHCKHVFCRPCLQDFWGMCISEGDVARVGCPDPECVKEKREAVEEEVARVLSDSEVARWRWLREKRNLEKDPTIIHCPIDQCQTPVPKPAGEDPDSGWDRFRECQRCSFSFCAFCRRTWHGPVTQCVMTHSEKIVLEYLAEDEGSEGRVALERRYGKTNILKLVAKYQEELANKEWLAESTTACPGCGCHVEKSLGCNHMTCWKCGKHFCYRCGAKIRADEPYIHFSQPGPCYQKLFDFQSQDEDWIPMFVD
ncbi:RWD-domain-containing protein [Coprinopsis marcescibilis]|uniref:RBR-type E3 ubiquitin transferase n=1 Tax=Coprinopsis marcescibilis TaxID=230819 RepID=A0A5C3KS89_COPMA|nr:RWD-domain-containing protein [Coprinopsis marcescibilis]